MEQKEPSQLRTRARRYSWRTRRRHFLAEAVGRTRVCDRAGPSDLQTRARARICRSPLEKPSGVHRTQGCREGRRDFQRRCRVRCNLALCLMCGAAASMAGWRRNLRVHRPRGRNMAGQGDLGGWSAASARTRAECVYVLGVGHAVASGDAIASVAGWARFWRRA